ncbi:ornithine--oxo-acid transaminase [Sulfidibacter corallicola]|uniref:ornithine aminotransferase n=1 Tax=Sulfidibacter corallicola TaxID=2818388 RepID=A0A8A4TSL5_SULCO|nr:ornithine--oxo-acid transaminase [Sulfidibacter corallicola]QTD52946.1 ornithine--oxo-acid transaminase [Sulfidibacter corallicola]
MSTTTKQSAVLIQQESEFGAHNYHPLDVVLCRGEGPYLWDVDGKRYMDFLAAYSAVNQGHNHPKIVEALVKQANTLALTSRAFRNDKFPPLLVKLNQMTGFDKALLMNSGAEAVETAIKAARKWGYDHKNIEEGKAEIIVMDGNFHGRTTTIIGFSTDDTTVKGFGPFSPGFHIAEFGNLEAVKSLINENTCAILVEPVQGEGGVVIPPKGFLKELRALTEREDILMFCDEIQSGLGRTGKMFAFEHEGIRPDGVTVGKALSGGVYPVSAFLANEKVMKVFTPGTHGSTYGGNPLACAVANAALDVLVDEDLVNQSATLGEYMTDRLRKIDSPHIKEVRGLGLWAGVELHESAGGARRFCERLQEEGMLCKETHTHTIRLAPPLVVTKEQLDWALDLFERVLKEG